MDLDLDLNFFNVTVRIFVAFAGPIYLCRDIKRIADSVQRGEHIHCKGRGKIW